tara:strand:+ start:326 stop:469 length:144 start_codon:yes stop_codon:yes gene_type:complete
MTIDYYVEIIGCALLTMAAILVICCTIWVCMSAYYDIIEKQKWRNRK